ncbi:Transposase [Balamuthia mandrillaris]
MKKQVRETFLNNGNFNGEDKSLAWVLETPRYICSDAVDDFFNGVKTSLAAGRTGFKMKFRGQAREWNHNSSTRQLFFREARIKARDKNYKVPSEVLFTVRLMKDTRLGHYYFCVPQPLKLMGESPAREHRRRGRHHRLGSRSAHIHDHLQRLREVTEWGKADIKEIGKLLQSRWTKTTHCHRYRMKKAAARIRFKIRNLVDDLHKKLVMWLVEHRLPPLSAQVRHPEDGY